MKKEDFRDSINQFIIKNKLDNDEHPITIKGTKLQISYSFMEPVFKTVPGTETKTILFFFKHTPDIKVPNGYKKWLDRDYIIEIEISELFDKINNKDIKIFCGRDYFSQLFGRWIGYEIFLDKNGFVFDAVCEWKVEKTWEEYKNQEINSEEKEVLKDLLSWKKTGDAPIARKIASKEGKLTGNLLQWLNFQRSDKNQYKLNYNTNLNSFLDFIFGFDTSKKIDDEVKLKKETILVEYDIEFNSSKYNPDTSAWISAKHPLEPKKYIHDFEFFSYYAFTEFLDDKVIEDLAVKNNAFDKAQKRVISGKIIYDELVFKNILKNLEIFQYDNNNDKVLSPKTDIAEIKTIKASSLDKVLKDKKDNFLSKFDSNNNNRLDIIEDDGFITFLKLHQDKIMNIDPSYVQKLVKLSHFLRDKGENLQQTFELILSAEDLDKLKVIKDNFELQISFYSITIIKSYEMILAVSKKDLISFFDLYEEFDSMGVFNSNWEKELSSTLSDIKEINKNTLKQMVLLSDQIVKIEQQLVDGFSKLDKIDDSINSMNASLTKELKGINNKLWWNNVFEMVQIYQNRKTNKLLS